MTVLVAAASGNDVAPGVFGFLIVAGIAVVLVFLLRSMNKQLRKITPQAHDGDAAPGAAPGSKPNGVGRA